MIDFPVSHFVSCCAPCSVLLYRYALFSVPAHRRRQGVLVLIREVKDWGVVAVRVATHVVAGRDNNGLVVVVLFLNGHLMGNSATMEAGSVTVWRGGVL